MMTVVIPLFNKKPYIQRALDSVYAQQPPVDEVVVVNDGSTDGGELIAKAQADSRVRVLDQPNRGVSAARNAGIDAASQPYVAFLDADDEWLPGFLAQICRMIERFPGAGLYGTGFTTVENGRELRRNGVRWREVEKTDACSPLRGVGEERPAFGPVDFFKVWKRRPVVHTSSMVVPREVAQAVGGFPAGVAICEDYEFLVKVALGYPVILAPDVLVRYDVAVPGQAVEYWKGLNRKGFSVLPYHRFLVEKLRKGAAETHGPLETDPLSRGGPSVASNRASFRAYCRAEIFKSLLQRLYWGDFSALREFDQELGLGSVELGLFVKACRWIASHPRCHSATASAMRMIRCVRNGLMTGRRLLRGSQA